MSGMTNQHPKTVLYLHLLVSSPCFLKVELNGSIKKQWGLFLGLLLPSHVNTVLSIHHELRKIPALQTLQGHSASPLYTFLSVALEWPLTPYPYQALNTMKTQWKQKIPSLQLHTKHLKQTSKVCTLKLHLNARMSQIKRLIKWH